MSELTLADVELTGEYRIPKEGDFYLCGPIVRNGPSGEVWAILRPKAAGVHDGHWAIEQMRAGREVCCGCGALTWRMDTKGHFWAGNKIAEWSDACFSRTDWRLWEEPKKEPASATPVADGFDKGTRGSGTDPRTLLECRLAIAALETRLAELKPPDTPQWKITPPNIYEAIHGIRCDLFGLGQRLEELEAKCEH